MRIIRLKEVIDSTGLARSTIYKYIKEGTFPKPVSLGARCVGWVAQWNEMIEDPTQKIGRPRQLYTGMTRRDFMPLAQRNWPRP